MAHAKVEVRIVAGSLKGRKITAMVHEKLRPTPQMVREALFSILGDAVPGRPFYDLFAGTGIIGLEAYSRGASEVKLIERDAKQAADIARVIEQFKIAPQVMCFTTDVFRWAETWRPPTVPVTVFLSPPFPELVGVSLERFQRLLNILFNKLPKGSVLVAQVEVGYPVEQLPDAPEWDIRTYGRNILLFRVRPEPHDNTAPPPTDTDDQ
jgi:16S rRNA (guanine966-N2)-methyltransferase